MRLVALALSACLILGAVSATAADNDDWRFAWDGTLYGYANSTNLRSDSVLNPGNQLGRLPQLSAVAELRLNLKAENDAVRLTARPIARACATNNSFGSEQCGEAYLSQWQARLRLAEDWNAAAGRDVLNWGPAQFRSPSSPFYFDSGRSDPMRELVGMDSLKLSWTPDLQSSVMLVYVDGPGEGGGQPVAWRKVWRDSWLAKFDQRGDEWAFSVLAAKAPDLPAFYGAYGQVTLSDALMIYAEVGSYALASALQSPADSAQPFAVQAASSRQATTLAGTSYTFEDGKSLDLEYLHNGHGYRSAQEDAFFERAATSPGTALGLMPRLLGREYLHLVWQSNVMEEQGYWRLMYTHNITDGSNEFSGYGETALSSRISAYGLATLPQGNAQQEFPALLQNSVTVGLKIALP